MLPVLFSFELPNFLGRIGWIEAAATVVVVVLLFLWRRRSPRFSPSGFVLWVVIYAALRALVWYAGPGYNFELHTYGVLIATGFVVGIYLAVRQAGREFINPNTVLDLAFWILIAAMVGSRLVFIVVNIEDYLADPILLFKIWQGGLVFYGGFIGAVLATWLYCRRAGLPFLRMADLLVPSLAIGHFFGRLGCFSAGCCHGAPTGLESFGAVFTASGSVVARNGLLDTPLHPSQLYESLGELAIFVVLIAFRKHKRFNGHLLALWLVSYSLWRFLTEMSRGDLERGMLLQISLFGGPHPEILSTSQMISLLLLAAGVILLLGRRARPGAVTGWRSGSSR